jgi:hypothetical protein
LFGSPFKLHPGWLRAQGSISSAARAWPESRVVPTWPPPSTATPPLLVVGAGAGASPHQPPAPARPGPLFAHPHPRTRKPPRFVTAAAPRPPRTRATRRPSIETRTRPGPMLSPRTRGAPPTGGRAGCMAGLDAAERRGAPPGAAQSPAPQSTGRAAVRGAPRLRSRLRSRPRPRARSISWRQRDAQPARRRVRVKGEDERRDGGAGRGARVVGVLVVATLRSVRKIQQRGWELGCRCCVGYKSGM